MCFYVVPPCDGGVKGRVGSLWSARDGAFTFDGQEWESWYISGVFMYDEDFRYSVEVSFSESSTGLAVYAEGGEAQVHVTVTAANNMRDK